MNSFNNVGINFAFSSLVLTVVAYWSGTVLRRFLPERWLTEHSTSAIRWSMLPLLLVTVLGFASMIITARMGYNERAALVETAASTIIHLDRQLNSWGPEADKIRMDLREYAKELASSRPMAILGQPSRLLSLPIQNKIYQLQAPPTDVIRPELKRKIIDMWTNYQQIRLNLATKADTLIYSFTVLVTMAWMMMLFFGMGATAPLNPATLIFGAAASASAASVFFLIGEFSHPLAGFIVIPERPMAVALKVLDANMPGGTTAQPLPAQPAAGAPAPPAATPPAPAPPKPAPAPPAAIAPPPPPHARHMRPHPPAKPPAAP